MAFLIDTNVAVALRDGDAAIMDKIAKLGEAIVMSGVSRVELEGGVYRHPELIGLRRARLDTILATIPSLTFDDSAADAYARIVAHAGYSRRKILDRMIAAQALVHHATLVTMNPDDFADVASLEVLVW